MPEGMLDKIVSLPPVEAIKTMGELNDAAGALQRAANHLYQNTLRFEGADGVGARYEIAVEAQIAKIYDDAIANETRPPAEDIRLAKAHSTVRADQPDLWKQYRDGKTDIDASRIWISATKAAINARQSVLRGERD